MRVLGLPLCNGFMNVEVGCRGMGFRHTLATIAVTLGILIGFLALAGFWISTLTHENRVLTRFDPGTDEEYRDGNESAGDKEVYKNNSAGSSNGTGVEGHGVMDGNHGEGGVSGPPAVCPGNDVNGVTVGGGLGCVDSVGESSDTGGAPVDVDVGIPNGVKGIGR